MHQSSINAGRQARPSLSQHPPIPYHTIPSWVRPSRFLTACSRPAVAGSALPPSCGCVMIRTCMLNFQCSRQPRPISSSLEFFRLPPVLFLSSPNLRLNLNLNLNLPPSSPSPLSAYNHLSTHHHARLLPRGEWQFSRDGIASPEATDRPIRANWSGSSD